MALIRYLKERGFIGIDHVDQSTEEYDLTITADGCKAIESRLLSPPVAVFISSTCYDLLDLLAELSEFLESNGFIVLASDDPYRFDVSPTEDSITSCLRNVETCDLVVCIIDRRYGPLLPPDKTRSATHVEIERARELQMPIYVFGRDRALLDLDQLRGNTDAKTRWVEGDIDDRKRWADFVNTLTSLRHAQENHHSNWCDQFSTSVQLKKLVLKRLMEYQRKVRS